MPARTSYAEGTPNWVDLQTTDVDAAKAFYAGIFGWTFNDQPMPEGGAYSLAMIDGDSVAAIAPQSEAMIEHEVPPMWNTYIAVDDVDSAAAKVAGTGGQLLMEPFDVMDAGRMAYVADPTGAAVGLWQASASIGATLVNEPNTLTWNELATNDIAAALPFYETVVGLTSKEVPMGEQKYTMLYVGDDFVGGATAAQMVAGAPNHWHVWFAVADADASAAAAAAGGGKVILEPTDMAIGRIAALQDPQGAYFSIIAAKPQA
jgi:predicted enzyme related to lactoylglutathione lyase